MRRTICSPQNPQRPPCLQVRPAVAHAERCQLLQQLLAGGVCPLAGVDAQDVGAGRQVGQGEHKLAVKPEGGRGWVGSARLWGGLRAGRTLTWRCRQQLRGPAAGGSGGMQACTHLPGRRSAPSSASTRLVAPITTTCAWVWLVGSESSTVWPGRVPVGTAGTARQAGTATSNYACTAQHMRLPYP